MADDPECTTREPVFIDINKEGATAVAVFIDINKEGATSIYWYQ